MKKEMELYLHIPFCAKKCDYCDFLSFPADKSIKREYVETLKQEIEEVGKRYRNYRVSTIFVGGGTPSILNSSYIVEIFDVLRRKFHVAGNAEISMEVNPGTVTKEKLSDWRRAGINRLSMGLQSADNRELKRLGRIHTWEDFLESFRRAREEGFSNLNVDLMSALPGQTMDGWMETLKRTAAQEPEHISAYSLIIEEGTPFYERYGGKKGEALLPDEDTDRDMYHKTREFLASCGFERYEISNYAKPGRECRHNIGYWTGVPYLGLGLGAASYIEGIRFSNTRNLKEYLAGKSGDDRDRQVLTKKEMEEEFFFLGLRLAAGVSLKEFERRFGLTAEEVYPGLMERMVKEGAAVLERDRFFLTEYGFDVSNYVMAQFLQDD
ncbi:MAG TPA: oxygen-independent coproporphyrinogen III oxidase [Candidatus Copromonas faecavium]|uniref:Heme chaperone HemW n=1 Tax=Candidatus Copromonas faecavium (nom. illeg.) TaxID=2840740 RepID=A0A9D1A6D6_9FIRM|nr:oxygen-independent coproporphyrinogen III oxidase [Candidatus Copromonas faecavium]